jgi:hypothetical protein
MRIPTCVWLAVCICAAGACEQTSPSADAGIEADGWADASDPGPAGDEDGPDAADAAGDPGGDPAPTCAPASVGQSLDMPWAGANGVFDVSLASDPDSGRLWMSHSGVVRQPSGDHVSTWLAYSTDGGAHWCPVGQVNPSRDLPDAERPPDLIALDQPAFWNHEVSALVRDPAAPPDERWRLVWHRYLHTNDGDPQTDDRRFVNGWVATKTAASPQELLSAPERKWIATPGYYVSAEVSDYNDRFQGPPELRLAEVDPDLADCVLVTEPGLLAANGVLYLSMLCGRMDRTNPIVLLGLDHSNASLSLRGQMLGSAEARHLDPNFEGFSATELFEKQGAHYLFVTPTIADGYRGCLAYPIDLQTGTLTDADSDGHPDPVFAFFLDPLTFHGMCAWDSALTHGGMIYGQAFLTEPPVFRLFPSGLTP